MKKLSLIISLLIASTLLSACATPMTATPTAFSETTSTSVPTSIPPTATIEPSPTVDPSMPEGATGKDAEGNWIKTENGVNVTWSKDLNTWERHLNVNNEGIPLVIFNEQQHTQGGMKDNFPLFVNVSDKMSGYNNVDSISPHPGAGDQDLSFANIFRYDIQKAFGITDMRQIQAGETTVTFTTVEGRQTINLNKSVIVDVFDQPTGGGFQQWKIADPSGTTFQSRLFADAQQNLHVWVVPGKQIDQLTHTQLLEMFLFGPASIIDSRDQRVQNISQEVINLSYSAVNPKILPFLDFVTPQQQ